MWKDRWNSKSSKASNNLNNKLYFLQIVIE